MTTPLDESSKTTMQSKKQDPLNFSMPQEFVTITVADHKFVIPKQLVCYYSPFFRAAFNGDFLEGRTQSMDLPETKLPVFGLFVNWLYTQQVRHAGAKPQPVKLMELNALWTLGGQWLVPRLQNAIIELMVDALWEAEEDEIGQFLEKICEGGWTKTKLQHMAQEVLLLKIRTINNSASQEQILEKFPVVFAKAFTILACQSQTKSSDGLSLSMFYEKVKD